MDVHGNGEAFSPQKRTSSTSKYEISICVGQFFPPGSGSTDLIESGSDPDPKHCLQSHLISVPPPAENAARQETRASLTSPPPLYRSSKSFPFILIMYEKSLVYGYVAYFRFGSVMLENLMSRGCLLSGVRACRDKAGDRNTSAHRMTHLKELGHEIEFKFASSPYDSVKGTGSRDIIQICFQKWIVLALTKNLYWFMDFFFFYLHNARMIDC